MSRAARSSWSKPGSAALPFCIFFFIPSYSFSLDNPRSYLPEPEVQEGTIILQKLFFLTDLLYHKMPIKSRFFTDFPVLKTIVKGRNVWYNRHGLTALYPVEMEPRPEFATMGCKLRRYCNQGCYGRHGRPNRLTEGTCASAYFFIERTFI